ncbi:MAG: hypothetical protein J5U17_12345, partial [Candidatus Methanoperedens sp.]|nr:hypothetical protein [Candidatus Methanoperedens sp.]
MKKDIELKESLKRLKELQAERGKVCGPLEDEMEIKTQEIAEKGKPFDDKISALNSAIVVLALEHGESFRSNDGAIGYKKGFPKITYKAKILDALCGADAVLKAQIWQYRTE